MTVGLTNKSVSITPSIRDTVTSKKLIEVFDHSAVNFMVGCALLILSINDFNLFSPCSHKKNKSSMYLHHKYRLYSDSFIISSSSSAINKMLYGGANFVPIAVPSFCLSVFFPNVNMLFFNTTSANEELYVEVCNNAAPLLKTINGVLAKIRKRGDLKRDTLDYFIMKDPKFARFYLLPKIHKRLHNVPGRPVISNSGYYTENISSFLDHHLQPLAQPVKSYIKDTNEF